MNTTEISGANLGRVEFISEKPYKNTKEGSPLAGKNYCTFRYQGKAFTIPSDSSIIPFLKDRTQRRNIKTIFLLETSYTQTNDQGVEETISSFTFDGFLTVEESLEYKKSSFEEAVLDAKLEAIIKGSFKVEAELSPEELELLGEGE